MFNSANKFDLQRTVELSNKELFQKYNPNGSGENESLVGKNGLETYQQNLRGASLSEVFKYAKNNPQFEESKDFLKLYEKFNRERSSVINITSLKTEKLKKDVKKSKKPVKETKKIITANKENLTIDKLKEGYIVKKNDILSILTKGIKISFKKEADNIWPGDKIVIEDSKIFRIRNGKKVAVGTLINNDVVNLTEIDTTAPSLNNTINSSESNNTTVSSSSENNNTIALNSSEVSDTTSSIEVIDNDSLITYFGLEKSEINKLNNLLSENGLKLDIFKLLNSYRKYIETNLQDLDNKFLSKIKKIIKIKTLQLEDIVNNRVAWVDEQIAEGDYKQEDRSKEIKNQRWIINSNFKKLFSDIENKILPSGLVLSSKQNTYTLDSQMNDEIKNMFNAEVTDDGDFDKTWRSGEIIDANTNSWSVIDTTDEEHIKFLNNNNINISIVNGVSLLSKEDEKIESTAMFAFYSLLAIQIGAEFTPVGWTAGALIDGADIFTDEDILLIGARKLPGVDVNYRMEKTWIDNALATIGLIPGATIAIKGTKLGKWFSALSPVEGEKFLSMLDKFAEKAGWNKEYLQTFKHRIFGTPKIDLPNKDQIIDLPVNTSTIPVIFYKNTQTGTTYTKTLDGKFFNSKGVELKGKPKNITEIKINQPKHNTAINKTKLLNNSNRLISDIESTQFNKILSIKLTKGEDITLVNSKGYNFTIKFEPDNKFTINGKNELYTKAELLKKIPDDFKLTYLDNITSNHILQLGKNETITLGGSFKKFKGEYKIMGNGDIHKLGSNKRKLTSQEKIDLLKKPEFRDIILKKALSKISVNDILKDITSSSKLLKAIDEKIANAPYYMGKPYSFSKWLLWENKLAKATRDSTLTPFTIAKNLTDSQLTNIEKFKSVLFADKDISYLLGTGKIALYATIPTTLELIINSDNYDELTYSETIKEVLLSYLSYMYLGVINSLILEFVLTEDKSEHNSPIGD